MLKKAAFFDIDGTIYHGIITVDFLIYVVKNKKLRLRDFLRIPKIFYYGFIDKFNIMDRTEVNRKIYTNLEGWDVNHINKIAEEFYLNVARKKFYSGALRLLNKHIKNKHKVVLVTSGLKNIVNPLKKYLNLSEVIGTEIGSIDGKFTGSVTSLPIGKNRADFVKEYCRLNNISIKEAYAYSDHYSDIPLLSIVGKPIAVNPDKKLKKTAKTNSWKTIIFK